MKDSIPSYEFEEALRPLLERLGHDWNSVSRVEITPNALEVTVIHPISAVRKESR